ncbi:unnamed protein product [Thlaspi arvense]|uniref:MATH domain-containing protein n=1 Tax=Thlaspi arvense TaxID=13288 RepID=A0AAU9RUK1_THLAR|nr:unnamed protein product [Thlaspi arvense]
MGSCKTYSRMWILILVFNQSVSSVSCTVSQNWRNVILLHIHSRSKTSRNSKTQLSSLTKNTSLVVSLLVDITDSISFVSTLSFEVFADLRFSVYNKRKNKFFTIQDVEAIKSFNTLRTVWGFPRVLPLDTFNDPINGYIYEADQCEFGVDFIVAPPPTNWKILSFHEKFPRPKFSWTVASFSKLKENSYTSTKFSMGGSYWVLKLYPKGNRRADGKWVSIFLCLDYNETLEADEKIYTRAHLRVQDPLGYNHITNKHDCWHDNQRECWGWYQFVSIADLHAYLDKEGSLSLDIEFEVVSTTI